MERQFRECVEIGAFLLKKNQELEQDHANLADRMHRQASKRAASDMQEVSMAEKVKQQEWQLREEKEKRKRLKTDLRAATVELDRQCTRNTEMR